jgi:hypothetical protein
MLPRARSEKPWLGRNEGIFLTPILSMDLKEKAKVAPTALLPGT